MKETDRLQNKSQNTCIQMWILKKRKAIERHTKWSIYLRKASALMRIMDRVTATLV